MAHKIGNDTLGSYGLEPRSSAGPCWDIDWGEEVKKQKAQAIDKGLGKSVFGLS
jgi:hypothetical protein